MRKPRVTKAITTARSTTGLRDALFDELDKLRSGKSNPSHANALAKVSAVIIETARLEIDVAKLFARAGESKEVKALEWANEACA